MAYTKDSKSSAVRAQLDHPVIDGDGHWLEPVPIFLDYLRQVAGPSVAERFVKKATEHIDRGWYDMTPAERLDRRPTRPTWWRARRHPGSRDGDDPAALLRAARRLRDRLRAPLHDARPLPHRQPRRGAAPRHRARPELHERGDVQAVRDRIAPAAVVPMHTPEEAIEEATYAVRELGLKVIMIANHVRRPVPAFARRLPSRPGASLRRLARVRERPRLRPVLGPLRRAEGGGDGTLRSMGWMGRESVNNFTFNHIGHFANASHAFAKALILGGVVHRFPRSASRCWRVGSAGPAISSPTSSRTGRSAAADGSARAAEQSRPADAEGALPPLGRTGVYEEKLDELMGCLSLVPRSSRSRR